MANRSNYLLKKFSLAFFLALCPILLHATNVSAQQGLIAGKYSKINPGVSTRNDVERLFPKAKTGEFYREENVVEFRDKGLSIRVEYSTGKCGDTLPDFGRFPKWTVIGTSYSWPDDTQISLTGVILDLRKLKRIQKSDVIVHENYMNDENGIDIVYDTKRRSVDGIYLRPSAQWIAKYGECP